MKRSIACFSLGLTILLAAPALAFDVAFTVIDGTESYVDIQVKGSWSDWAVLHPMDDSDGDHTWTLTLDIEPGEYEWGAVENDGSEYGIWLIEGPNLVVAVDAEGNVSGQTSFEIPPRPDPITVTFHVDMTGETVSPQGVHLAGSFGADGYPEWLPGAIALADADGDGIYAVTLDLSESTEYLFVYVNGSDWSGQESVPAECGLDNGYGGYNRAYTTPDAVAGPQEVAFVFGSCEVPTATDQRSLSTVKALFR